jgi:hypothetical protein
MNRQLDLDLPVVRCRSCTPRTCEYLNCDDEMMDLVACPEHARVTALDLSEAAAGCALGGVDLTDRASVKAALLKRCPEIVERVRGLNNFLDRLINWASV